MTRLYGAGYTVGIYTVRPAPCTVYRVTVQPQTMFHPDQEQIDQIELREESVQELMSRPPNWLVRQGTMAMSLVLILLLSLSWWVQYPDIVRAQIVISTPQPPVNVVAKAGGNLGRLFVRDGEQVRAQQRLAVLHSIADADAVFQLQGFLQSIADLHPDSLLHLDLPTNALLGELQSGYAVFLQQLDQYQLFLSQQTDLQQIPFIYNEIDYYKKLDTQLQAKDSLLQGELVLAQQKAKRMREALSIGGVAVDAVEQAESLVLTQKRQLNDLALQRVQHQIRINDLEKQIETIRQRTQESAQGRYLSLKESFQRLRAEVDTWLNQYVVVAPIEGRVAFHRIWSDRQYLQAGETLLSVIPDSSGLIGRMTLPVQGSGKVEVGQRVNIELLAYPRNEYGTVEGRIEKIALLAEDGHLAVEVSLPNGMQSHYNKSLAFRPNMQGSAEIITRPRRLLQRVVDNALGGR